MEAPNPNLAWLLNQAREGDSAALGQVLEVYRNYLALAARVQVGRRLQGKVDASDLVQEAYLEAHRHFHRFRGQTERELLGWLRQILATTLAHQVRRYLGAKRRDLRLERRLAEEMDQSFQALNQGLIADQTSPSQQASRREHAVLLADALKELPEDYREVLILRHLEGLSFPEVSRRMDRSVDSVEKLWIRALTRLRGLLGGEK